MNRSTGVTVIAVLQLLGSALTFVTGLLAVVFAILVPMPVTTQSPTSPRFYVAVMLVVAVISYFLPAIWGIVTGIGLFRLRNWARISTIVFSILLIAMGCFVAITPFMIPTPAIPGQVTDNSVMIFLRVFMGIFGAGFLGLGLWWIIFFTRPKVTAQFSSYQAEISGALTLSTSSAIQRPLSITVIAWLLLAGCIFFPLAMVFHSPAAIFTKILNGWPSFFLYGGFCLLNLWIGVGLLRLWLLARRLAIAYLIFGFLNSAIFWLAPGGQARALAIAESQKSTFPWMKMWQQQPGLQFNQTPFMVMGIVLGLAACALQLYFLITRKQRFEQAAAKQAA